MVSCSGALHQPVLLVRATPSLSAARLKWRGQDTYHFRQPAPKCPVTILYSAAIMAGMQVTQVPPRLANETNGLLAFVLAHFGHHLCTAAAIPLLPMIRDSFGLDYFQSGMLISAFSLTYGLSQLPMAAVAEKFGKRRIIALGLAGTGIACLSAALSTSYLQILLSLVLVGVAGSTYHAPAAALLSQIAGKAGRGRYLGMHVVGGSSGLMAAPVITILVANLTGSWRYSFVAIAVPIFLASAIVWLVRPPSETAHVQIASDTEVTAP